MGWDLCSRKNRSYFRVSMYDWPRLALALEYCGADVSRMSEHNEGAYVPKRVAESWAKALEGGVDSLKTAILTDRLCMNGEGYFHVPVGFNDKDVVGLIRDYYGEPQKRQDLITLKRVEPLSDEAREWLLSFAKFCRKSKGFEQW